MAEKGTITDDMIKGLLERPWGGGLQSDIVKSIATGGDFLRRGVGAVGRVVKDIESVPAFAAAASLNYLTGGGAQGLVDKRGQALENTMNRYGLGDNTTTMPTKNISISPQSNQIKPTMPSPAANQPAPTQPKEPTFGSREWATSKFKSPDEAHAWLDKHIEDRNTKYANMSNEDFKKMVGEVNDYTQSNKPGGMGWIEVQGAVPKGGQKFTRVINQKGETGGGIGFNRDLTANELHAIAPFVSAMENAKYREGSADLEERRLQFEMDKFAKTMDMKDPVNVMKLASAFAPKKAVERFDDNGDVIKESVPDIDAGMELVRKYYPQANIPEPQKPKRNWEVFWNNAAISAAKNPKETALRLKKEGFTKEKLQSDPYFKDKSWIKDILKNY